MERMTKRLHKDLETIQRNYKDQFDVKLVNDNIKHWHVGIVGPKDSVFAGEKYT